MRRQFVKAWRYYLEHLVNQHESSEGEKFTEARFPTKLKFLFQPARYKVLYGGRGGAKSWGVARALLLLGMQKKLLILCTREYQNSLDDSVYKILAEQIKSMGLENFYQIQSTTITGANDTQFIFKGLKVNINSVKSFEGVDITWCEEAQTISKTSWDVLIPTIRKLGSEIWITFNPSLETDETYQRFVLKPPESAIVRKVNYSDNPWFPEVLREEMEDLRNRDPDAYLNVWEGHCRQTLDGAIYAKEIREATEAGRITRVPYDKSKPVHTVWDLGFSDSTSIWIFQSIAFEIRLIDFIQVQQATVPDILKILQEKPYTYDMDYLPHDAQAKTLASAGRSIEQMLKAAGRKVKIVPKLSLVDGINAARTLFSQCYFDEVKCADGLQCLRHYRYEVDPDTGNFSRNPLHDSNSHAADSFRYLAVSWRDSSQGRNKSQLKGVEPKVSYWGKSRGDVSTGWMGV